MRTICMSPAITLLLIATAAQALATQPQNGTIVVRGTRIEPAEARERAVEFIKRAGVAKGQKQVARWVVPICIKVIGVEDGQAARIEQNMLEIAAAANIDIAGPRCEPNITVSFTTDPRQVVRHIKTRKPNQFRELSFADRERVLTGDATVRWWYATQMVDRDGVKSNNFSPGWVSAGKSDAAAATTDPITVGGVGEMTSTQQYNSGSNVRTPTLRSLYGATVVVDGLRIGTASVDAIADYAAMVAFAEMDASDPPPPDSILGLFQPNSIETSLTDWDLAFLKSLYRMPLDRRARIQRGHLVEALLDERLPKEPKSKRR